MKNKFSTKLISLILAMVLTLLAFPLTTFAEELKDETAESESEQLYVKSIRLSRADSKEKAKDELESAGYIFLDSNLNEGTGNDGIYLGYTTTSDPSEAIYDIKLMNMKGGFTLTSLDKMLESQKTAFTQMAEDLELLVDEFALAYRDESLPAQKAYKALNFFRMVDNEGEVLAEKNGLGYHLVNGNMNTEDYIELLLYCDSQIVDSIIKILTMGIQVRSENWLARLSALGEYDSDMEYGDNEEELRRRAEQLVLVLDLYASAYNGMEATGIVSGEFNEKFEIENAEQNPAYDLSASDAQAKKLDINRYKAYKVAFDKLETYPYGNGTLKDFFTSINENTSYKKLYPLLSVLTDGEYSAMSYGCVLEVIVGADIDDSAFAVYDEVFALATEKVKSLYLYGGVDSALIDEDAVVAFTDEANRHMAATGELEFYENKTTAEAIWEEGKNAAMLVGAIGLGTMALAKIIIGTTMLVTATWSVSGACSLAYVGPLIKLCAFVSNPYAMLFVLAVTAGVLIGSYIMSAVSEWLNGKIDWDDNPIPEYIYDVREIGMQQTSDDGSVTTSYVRMPTFIMYEAVRSPEGKLIDLNARSKNQSQWLAMYVSYDSLGEDTKPIKADELLVKTGNGETPEGYTPVCEFGEVIAKDMNSYDEDNSVNGIYMFFKQDNEVVVDKDKTYYISDVYLQAGESPEHCIGLLEAAGYTPINVDLSPDSEEPGWFSGDKIYTYLGYKVTTNKNNAIRDIRVEYNKNISPFNYGGATYAECGTSNRATLYASKFSNTGTPILAGSLTVVNNRADAPVGYEPVNFFAGGDAVSFNGRDTYLREGDCDDPYFVYFLPETAFTEGEAYLGGIAYLGGKEDDVDPLVKELKDEMNELIVANGGAAFDPKTDEEKLVFTMQYLTLALGFDGYSEGCDDSINAFLFSKTYNPYRALYGIKATNYDDVPSEIVYESAGYTTIHALNFYTHGFGSDVYYVKPHHLIDNTIMEGAIELEGKLYVTGNAANNTYSAVKKEMTKKQPIKFADVLCFSNTYDKDKLPTEEQGYLPLTDLYKDSEKPIKFHNGTPSDGYETDSSFTIYLSTDSEEELPYVSQIFFLDSAELFRNYGGADSGASINMMTRGLVLSALSGQGATHFCSESFRMLGWEGNETTANAVLSTFYFAYSKSEKASDAYRDMFLYYTGINNEAAPDTLYRGSSKYEMICKINYNFTTNENGYAPGVYLYATKDKDAGERIVDFTVSSSPFKEGYETVRTMDGRSLVCEIVEKLEEEIDSQPFGSGKAALKQWLTFFKPVMGGQDPLHSYYYLHFKREGDTSIEEKKPYISELHLATKHGNKAAMLDELFDKGADGYVNKNLNAGTALGDDIYLGYTRTENRDEALTDIRAYHKKSPKSTMTDENGIEYTLVNKLDLNKAAGFWSDYIYLYTTKDTDAGCPITALTHTSKVKNQKLYTTVDGTEVLEAEITAVKKWNSNSSSDLNEGAGGDYIYLVATHSPISKESDYEDPDHGKDKTYTRKEVEGAAEGKYVAALYVMDKNTIRLEKIANGEDVDCEDITDDEVKARLLAMGATEIVETPILVSSDSYGKNNKNKVFIGYSRTDTLKKAIKDIAIGVELLSSDEPEDKIYVNKRSFTLVAEAASKVTELPKAINLIGLEGLENALVPRMYLYYTTSGDTPIYDVTIDSSLLLGGYGTALSQNGNEPFSDLYSIANTTMKEIDDGKDLGGSFMSGGYEHYDFSSEATKEWIKSIRDLFNPKNEKLSPFYIHTKRFEGESIKEEKPYVTKLFVATGSTEKEALTALASYAPDDFVKLDLNEGAGGDYIYLGFMRSDDEREALTSLIILTNGSPTQTKRVYSDSSTYLLYKLVSNTDLNKGAGGNKLYLYYTNNEKAGSPILDIDITSSVAESNNQNSYYAARLVDGTTLKNENANVNKGTDGDKLYIVTKIATEDKTSDLPASLIGTGSIIAIMVLLAVGALAALVPYLIKRKKAKQPDENGENSEDTENQ